MASHETWPYPGILEYTIHHDHIDICSPWELPRRPVIIVGKNHPNANFGQVWGACQRLANDTLVVVNFVFNRRKYFVDPVANDLPHNPMDARIPDPVRPMATGNGT